MIAMMRMMIVVLRGPDTSDRDIPDAPYESQDIKISEPLLLEKLEFDVLKPEIKFRCKAHDFTLDSTQIFLCSIPKVSEEDNDSLVVQTVPARVMYALYFSRKLLLRLTYFCVFSVLSCNPFIPEVDRGGTICSTCLGYHFHRNYG
jgi:hypothetical protein